MRISENYNIHAFIFSVITNGEKRIRNIKYIHLAFCKISDSDYFTGAL